MEVASRQGFIFSPKIDLYLFFTPILVAILLTLIGKWFSFTSGPLAQEGAYYFSILLNLPHVFATLFKTYLDPEERKRLSTLLFLTPIGCFLFAWALQVANPQILLIFLAYMAMFHHLRQQYGLMMISAKKAQTSPTDLWWDRMLIYSLTLYCLIRLHTLSATPFWFEAGDMYALPVIFEKVSHLLFAVVFVVYLVREVSLKRKIWGKYVVIISTLLTWYVSVHLRSFPWCVLLLGINHNVTYLFFVFFYQQQKKSMWFQKGRFILPYLFLVALAIGEEWAWPRAESSTYGQNIWISLLYVPQLVHYVLDAFIWRRGHYRPEFKRSEYSPSQSR